MKKLITFAAFLISTATFASYTCTLEKNADGWTWLSGPFLLEDSEVKEVQIGTSSSSPTAKVIFGSYTPGLMVLSAWFYPTEYEKGESKNEYNAQIFNIIDEGTRFIHLSTSNDAGDFKVICELVENQSLNLNDNEESKESHVNENELKTDKAIPE